MSKDHKTMVLYRLQSVSRLARTLLATRLLESGLYAGQDAVMLQLASKDGLPPSVLAQRLGVRPPTITKTIARMQSQGFVVKKSSDRDQRQSHIFLTSLGRETLKAIEKAIRRTDKDMLKKLDKKERKAILKMLERMENSLLVRGHSVRLDDDIDQETVEGEQPE